MFDSHENGLSKHFRQVHGSHATKRLLTNCSSHTENIRTLVFRMDLISFGPYVKTAVATWASQMVVQKERWCSCDFLHCKEALFLDKFSGFKVIHFSALMSSQRSTWKMTTQIKLDIT